MVSLAPVKQLVTFQEVLLIRATKHLIAGGSRISGTYAIKLISVEFTTLIVDNIEQ
jgi:hypothetical protein